MKITDIQETKIYSLFTVEFDDGIKVILLDKVHFNAFIDAVNYGKSLHHDHFEVSNEVSLEEMLLHYKAIFKIKSTGNRFQTWVYDDIDFNKELLTNDRLKLFFGA